MDFQNKQEIKFVMIFVYTGMRCVNENSINYQEEKEGNFISAKLRIRTQEADSQKARRTVLPVGNRRYSHIHF